MLIILLPQGIILAFFPHVIKLYTVTRMLGLDDIGNLREVLTHLQRSRAVKHEKKRSLVAKLQVALATRVSFPCRGAAPLELERQVEAPLHIYLPNRLQIRTKLFHTGSTDLQHNIINITIQQKLHDFA